MCRLLAYLGDPIALETLMTEPAHSLYVQSYKPQEMTSGTLNADGFGVAWYDAALSQEPFVYKNILPIWNDVNLPSLGRYIRTPCFSAYVRSATLGISLDFSNSQPFVSGPLSYIHNGFVKDFRQTLYRPLRQALSAQTYNQLIGSSDSEHLFAWFLEHLPTPQEGKYTLSVLAETLAHSLRRLEELAPDVQMTLNLVINDGSQLVASRFAYHAPAPSLYWLQGHPDFPEATILASEPLFAHANWKPCPEGSVFCVDAKHNVEFIPIFRA